MHPGARVGGDEALRRGVLRLGDVESQAERAAGVHHGPAADQPERVRQVEAGLRDQAEQGAPEQHERVHLPRWQGDGEVIDGLQPGARRRFRGEDEVLRPEIGAVAGDEVDQRAVGAAHRRDLPLAGADPLVPVGDEERLGPLQHARRVIEAERHGADGGAVVLEVLGGGGILLAVEHEVDVALAIQLDILGAVPPGKAEAEPEQETGERVAGRDVHGELQELDAVDLGQLRQRGAAGFGLGEDERAQPVAGDHA